MKRPQRSEYYQSALRTRAVWKSGRKNSWVGGAQNVQSLLTVGDAMSAVANTLRLVQKVLDEQQAPKHGDLFKKHGVQPQELEPSEPEMSLPL